MTITLAPTYVTAYPEMNSGSQSSSLGPSLNSGQSFPPGRPNPVAMSLETRINNYVGANYLSTFQDFLSLHEWRVHSKIELKALSAADQLCAEGQELRTVLNKIVYHLKGCQQINEHIIKYPTTGRIFSGGLLSGLHGIQHSIDGLGQPATFPIQNIGLKVNLLQVPDVMSAIHSARPLGRSPLDVKFLYNVSQDSLSSGLVLGTITLRVVGQVDKNVSGTWSFNGTIRAFNDKYDANPSSHRSWLGEKLTSILGKVMKHEYTIVIPGEIQVNIIEQ